MSLTADISKGKDELKARLDTANEKVSVLQEEIADITMHLDAIAAFEEVLASKGTAKKTRAPRATAGTKRQAILDLLKGKDGMKRADIILALGAKGNKAEEQSVSNALANMAKARTIANNSGVYTLP